MYDHRYKGIQKSAGKAYPSTRTKTMSMRRKIHRLHGGITQEWKYHSVQHSEIAFDAVPAISVVSLDWRSNFEKKQLFNKYISVISQLYTKPT